MSTDDESSLWQATIDPTTGMAVLNGEFDFSNSTQIRAWLHDFCQTRSGNIDLDLAKVSYIDSSGLAVLIELRKHLRTQNRTIRISSASEQVRKLFSLTQIGDLFGI